MGTSTIHQDPRVERIVAPNPGPMTLEGTNTYLIGSRYLIDPGPDDPAHLQNLAALAADVAAILLTHLHPDHADAAAMLAATLGVPVLAGPGSNQRWIAEEVTDGSLLPVEGGVLRVIETPGHTPEHVAFYLEDAGILFAGDTVLGRGTSVIAPPEGDMDAYVHTLQHLLDLQPQVIAPGHGPLIGPEVLTDYLHHRREREEQIVQALNQGPRSVPAIVDAVYGNLDPALLPLAAASATAHLIKLVAEGRVRAVGDAYFLTADLTGQNPAKG